MFIYKLKHSSKLRDRRKTSVHHNTLFNMHVNTVLSVNTAMHCCVSSNKEFLIMHKSNVTDRNGLYSI